MKVSINKPCHENWDAMTPNEQGSFCLACQKTVVDFSNKTTAEIKSFFNSIATTEKVCGRFKEDQLTELSFDDFFTRFKNWILPKKLAVIMYFVFGMALFSCQTTHHEQVMGKVAYEEPIDNASLDTKSFIAKDTVEIAEDIMKLGEVAMEPMPQPVPANFTKVVTSVTNTVTPKQPKNIKRPVEEIYLKGDVAFIPEDTIKKTICVPKDTLPEKHKMGKVKIGD